MTRRRKEIDGYHPIADYGVIGDCHTVALIVKDGSVDWYCPTRFDTPAVFSRLLDARKGGFLSILPKGGHFRVQRSYLGSTNILESTYDTGTFRMRVTDFMPVHKRGDTFRGHDVGSSRRLIRLVEGLRGESEVRLRFRPAFDYGMGRTEVSIEPGTVMLAQKQGRYLSLACPGSDPEFEADDGAGVQSRLKVEAGKRYWLVLTDSDNPDRAVELPSAAQCGNQLERTRDYWESWSGECTYKGPYREQVVRSALVLKLLTYEPTGAVVAAPTSSLPEEIGGERNWDYRYAWLRDASLILYALMGIGHEQEAADFFEWLLETHRKDPSPNLHVLYRVDGQYEQEETALDRLEGYRRSWPVRIGNAAGTQLQLDIYGEILTAAYLYFKSGIGGSGAESATQSGRGRLLVRDWPLLAGLVDRAVRRWREPDNGIWEVRGDREQFVYSKVMCWAAVDRGLRLAQEYALKAPSSRWRRERQAIRDAILSSGFNEKRKAFVQSLGGSTVDASALAISRVGLLPPTDPKMQSTISAVLSELTQSGLVYRYRSADGLSGREATFALCTFWLVDALALSGRLDEAHDLFERVIGYANDLGLLSEEIDPETRELLGNFPQGFTHMALINAAVNLAKAAKHGAEIEPETEVERASRGSKAAQEGHSARGSWRQ